MKIYEKTFSNFKFYEYIEMKILTLSWRGPLSYRNQSTDLLHKSMDWFLYDNGPRHERVKLLNQAHPVYILKLILLDYIENQRWTKLN